MKNHVEIRLRCVGGVLQPWSNDGWLARAVDESDLPEVRERAVRVTVEDALGYALNPVARALLALERHLGERGALHVETIAAHPTLASVWALLADEARPGGGEAAELLIEMFAERIDRVTSQEGADRLYADVMRAGQALQVRELGDYVRAWLERANGPMRAAFFGLLVVARSEELAGPPSHVRRGAGR